MLLVEAVPHGLPLGMAPGAQIQLRAEPYHIRPDAAVKIHLLPAGSGGIIHLFRRPLIGKLLLSQLPLGDSHLFIINLLCSVSGMPHPEAADRRRLFPQRPFDQFSATHTLLLPGLSVDAFCRLIGKGADQLRAGVKEMIRR